jgi:hypothetical protein
MDRVEQQLVLNALLVIFIVGIVWSRLRYRGAYSEHYGTEVPRGWLWKRDPERRIERLRYMHIAILVGALVVLVLSVQTLFGPK